MDDTYQQFHIKATPGMNTKSEELELNGRYVKLAQNLRYEDEPGAVTKRAPLTTYNPTPIGTDSGCLGSYRYYGQGNIKTLVAWGDKVYVGDDTLGTFTEIKDYSTDTRRTSFVTYKDVVIGCNGVDTPWVYDGSNDNVTWELGGCKALEGAAGTITATNISYKITYDDDAYIPDTVSNTIASVTGAQIELTNIPRPLVGAVNRKVYRQDNGAGVWGLVGTITDNTLTTFTDNTAAIGGGIGGVTDEMPIGDILVVHKERLFITGAAEPNFIYYSQPFLPHYITQTTDESFLRVAIDDGDEIMGLAVHYGTMVCFKRNTIRKMFVAQAGSGADPASWYADDPIAYIGTPCKWSITPTPWGIVFLGWDSWYIYDGSRPQVLIDEFDVADILTTNFTDVIGFYNKEVFYAAYTDADTAAKTNDKIMVYNMKRKKFSVDTVQASCFSAHTGDSESGELFIGDSTEGTLYKAEEGTLAYRLSSKTQANAGTGDNVFIGGTEQSPYIEIGGDTSAVKIPDNICIFWDDPTTNPGSGWTDITADLEGKYIMIKEQDNANVAGSGHTHPMTGNLALDTDAFVGCGNNQDNVSLNNHHTHSANGNSKNETTTYGPRHVVLRLFKKNSTTEEFVFPNGAMVMWDLASTPVGFSVEGGAIGYYIKGGAAANYLENVSASHGHTYDYVSGGNSPNQRQDSYNGDQSGPQTADCINYREDISGSSHTHDVTGTLASRDDTTWELTHCSFNFIRKLSEQDTWDGVANYVYCLYDGDPSGVLPLNGWEVEDGYEDRFLKMGSSAPTTGEAAGATHDHDDPSAQTTSGFNGTTAGSSADNDAVPKDHTHQITVSVGDGTHSNPPYRTFTLVKKILGHMKTYNSALTVAETNGSWVSPGLNLNAETLDNVEWNLSKGDNDTFEWHIRTAGTQAAVEAFSSTLTVTNASDLFTLVSHGLTNGDRITFGGTPPAEIATNIMYYVISVAGDDFQVSLTSGGAAVSFTDDGTAVTFKKWEDAQTISGSELDPSDALVPAPWIQYILVFTAVDTTVDNPKIFLSSNYAVRILYTRSGANAETGVEFIYQTGFMNADTPIMDKIWKKLQLEHNGSLGSYTCTWTTEHATGTFTIDLITNPSSFHTFFQSDAMGRRIDFKFYKNDLEDFQLREIQSMYTGKPVII